MSQSILDVRDLKVTFTTKRSSKEILKGISFSVREGECLGILGESGSGKSMTTKAILGLLNQDFHITGEAYFQNTSLLEASSESLRQLRGTEVGMILQNPMTCFDPLYTIGNQMFETFDAHGVVEKSEYVNKAIEVLESMRIREPQEVLKKFPHQVSGGMLQRIMIGIALSMKPKLLICDEPTTAIDSITQYGIIQEFLRIKKESNVGMVFITHDVSVISHVADRLIVLNKGELVDAGTVEDILRRPKDPYTQLLVEKKLAVAKAYRDLMGGGNL